MRKYTSFLKCAVFFLACTPVQSQEVTLHMGHNTFIEDPYHIASEKFAEAVRVATGGEVNIVIHPAEQLAGLRAGAEGVQIGTVDLYIVDSGTLGNWQPHYSFVSLPFIFADFDAANAAMDALEDELVEGMRQDLGVERLAWSPAGFRVIVTTSRAIDRAEDLKGLKIRVPEIPLFVTTFGGLGANATPLPWGDVYSALQTGVVEGVEGPSNAINVAHFQEVATYITRTNHMMLDLNILMNLDKFQSLSEAHQAILREAAHQAFDVDLRAVMQTQDDVAYRALAEALEENAAPDMTSFREAMAPVYDEFIAGSDARAAAWIAAVLGQQP